VQKFKRLFAIKGGIAKSGLAIVAVIVIVKMSILLAAHILGLDILKIIGAVAVSKFLLLPALLACFQYFRSKSQETSGGHK